MKFGHAITETEVKSAKVSPTCANDFSHPRTCPLQVNSCFINRQYSAFYIWRSNSYIHTIVNVWWDYIDHISL